MGSQVALVAQRDHAEVTGFPARHPPFQDVMYMGECLTAYDAALVLPKVGHALKVTLACCAHNLILG
jgi:hypothetical protein